MNIMYYFTNFISVIAVDALTHTIFISCSLFLPIDFLGSEPGINDEFTHILKIYNLLYHPEA